MQDFSAGAAWIKGEVMPVGQASIGVLDWGLTHSDITYDVVPVWQGAFFRLGDYIARFRDSVTALRLDIAQQDAEIAAILHQIVAASGLQNAYVAMVASRGGPLIPGTRDPRYCDNHFYAWCIPYVNIIPPEQIASGVSVWVGDGVFRIPENSVNPRAKNYHWGDFTTGLFQAKDAGYDTVVLLDHAGNVTEGPGFNIFALKGDTVTTSDHGVLHGLTRRTALELCATTGLNCETRPLPLSELLDADEVFLSSSSGGIMPVTRVGERIFSNGAPGPMASKLRDRYYNLMATSNMRTPVNYGT